MLTLPEALFIFSKTYHNKLKQKTENNKRTESKQKNTSARSKTEKQNTRHEQKLEKYRKKAQLKQTNKSNRNLEQTKKLITWYLTLFLLERNSLRSVEMENADCNNCAYV